MGIVAVGVIAVGSAIFGFLTAALLSAAKSSDVTPTRRPTPETRILSRPSQN